MIVEYSLNNADHMRQWDDFVRSHPEGTPFHLYAWIKTISESYGFESYLLAMKDDCGIITAILPLLRIRSCLRGSRLVSLPFSDYCGPLCANSEDEKDLMAWVKELFGNKARYVEIRSKLMNSAFFKCDAFYKRHILELNHDASKVMEKLDRKTIRYSIRKAREAGVEIQEENSSWGMAEFYRLNRMTRKKHGIPHQPSRFFSNMFKNMFSGNGAFLLLAVYDSRVIAGGLFFRLNNTVYYKYNASDPMFLTDKKPNHLLTWRAIEKACLENFAFFDFGRTSPCNGGLMRYKEMWGAEAMELPYYYYPKVKGLNCGKTVGSSMLDRISTIWQRLPDPIVDALSCRIIKYLA